ncbi:unnamed protein product [Choristocarpus tenellus]
MQPVNAFVFVSDGILQGSLDFAYEAFTMAVSATIAGAYIISQGTEGVKLEDIWVGLVLLQSCRAFTFSARFWLDPGGPLASPWGGNRFVSSGDEVASGDGGGKG